MSKIGHEVTDSAGKQRSRLDEGHEMPQQQVHSYVEQRSFKSQSCRADFRDRRGFARGGSHQEYFLVTVAPWYPMDGHRCCKGTCWPKERDPGLSKSRWNLQLGRSRDPGEDKKEIRHRRVAREEESEDEERKGADEEEREQEPERIVLKALKEGR
ncbi:hypothetical protein N7486_007072 [Penicillium sp. IBT 16267x]|nr:hypothetical protein N7486_007072 [Penicillium sp. IBT 16267x]